MRHLSIFLFIFCPSLLFGQLHPIISEKESLIPDFNGDILKVTQRSYGKYLYLFGRKTKIILNCCFSNWKYVYNKDSTNKNIEETIYIKDQILSKHLIVREVFSDSIVEEEIGLYPDKSKFDKRIWIYFLGLDSQINKAEYLFYNNRRNLYHLDIIQNNIKYCDNKIISYTEKRIFNENDTIIVNYYLKYDSLKRIKSIILTTTSYDGIENWIFNYSNGGLLKSYSINYSGFFPEPYPYKKIVYSFNYDNHNNWIKKYLAYDNYKGRLQEKRKIKYNN